MRVSVFPKTVAFRKLKYGVDHDAYSTVFSFFVKFRQCPVQGNSHVQAMIVLFWAKSGCVQEIALTCEQGSPNKKPGEFAWQLNFFIIHQFEFFAEMHDKRLCDLLVPMYHTAYGIKRVRMPRVAVQPFNAREHIIIANGQSF